MQIDRAWIRITKRIQGAVLFIFFGAFFLFVIPFFWLMSRFSSRIRRLRGRTATTYWRQKKNTPVNPDYLKRMG